MKTVAHHHWGAQESVLLTLYRSLIRSKLDYGSTIYASAGNKLLSSLDIVANSALRIATGAFRSSPINSLYRECGEPPLWIRRQQLQLSLAARISANASNPVYPLLFDNTQDPIYENHPKRPQPFVKSYKNLQISVDLKDSHPIKPADSPPWTIDLPTCDTSLLRHPKDNTPPEMYRQLIIEATTNYRCTETYYTDGSKNEEGVGCSIVNGEIVEKIRLPSICSVFTAEMFALLRAIQSANQSPSYRFLICTDSLSSIYSISSLYPTNPLVIEIQENLRFLAAQSKSIVLMWVPSHCAIPGNEKADINAKNATLNENIETIQLHYDVISHIKFVSKKTWQDYWSTLLNNKLHQIEQTVQFKRLPKLTRREEVVIRRLRIGHSLLTHRHLLEKQPTPVCVSCDTQVTISHVLLSCRTSEKLRHQCFGNEDLESILSLDPQKTANVLKFLRESDLFKVL